MFTWWKSSAESHPTRSDLDHDLRLGCGTGLDAGSIYHKKSLYLLASAEEILMRADELIELMLEHILRVETIATPQESEAMPFKRCIHDQSNLISVLLVIYPRGTTRSVYLIPRAILMLT